MSEVQQRSGTERQKNTWHLQIQIHRRLFGFTSVLCLILLFTYLRLLNEGHVPMLFLTDEAHNVNVNVNTSRHVYVNDPRRDPPLSSMDKAHNDYVNNSRRHPPQFSMDKAHNVNANTLRRDQTLFLTDKGNNTNVNVNTSRYGAASQSDTVDTTSFCRRPLDYSYSIYRPVKVKGQPAYAEDLMSVEPFKYLDNFKNPCFRRDGRNISCFPYYFLTGTPKSGTTDLSLRIKLHPQVSKKVAKEPHWITRGRFTFDGTKYPTIYTYIESYFSRAARDIVENKNGSFHPKVVGDCSASTLWDNYQWRLLKKNQNRSEPLHTNADFIHHINPNAKIIAILRNPIDRLYSGYLFFLQSPNKSREDFHARAHRTVHHYNKCLARCSARHCLNFNREHFMIGLGIGLYYYSIYDWMKVFPREQILVIKMEDYSANMKQTMEEIFKFLELEPLDDDSMAVVTDTKHIHNGNKHALEVHGTMLPETRAMLYQFYKPHTEKLETLLGTKFWEDES